MQKGLYLVESSHPIRLTTAEMGTLWTTYINDTMAKCILSYFLNKVEDIEIRPVIELALHLAEQHIEQLTELFDAERFPVPQGFSVEDVNVNAKRLFSDSFFVYYIKNMAKVGLATYSMSYTMASRADIRKFFNDCLSKTAELDQQATELLQSKGLYIRPPQVTIPVNIDFVDDKSFLSGGFFGLAEKRPLLSVEIAHLFANLQTNSLGKALLMGFAQVARSRDIRQYMLQGKDLSTNHIKVFSELLVNEDLPAPMTYDADVSDSTEAPFSDKLMLYHISLLVAAGTANYGAATAASPRRDIAANYVRLAAEIATYAADGAKLMIEKRWLEEPPQAVNRKELTKV